MLCYFIGFYDIADSVLANRATNRKRGRPFTSGLLEGAIKGMSINRPLFLFIPQGKKDVSVFTSTFDIAFVTGVFMSGYYAAIDQSVQQEPSSQIKVA